MFNGYLFADSAFFWRLVSLAKPSASMSSGASSGMNGNESGSSVLTVSTGLGYVVLLNSILNPGRLSGGREYLFMMLVVCLCKAL